MVSVFRHSVVAALTVQLAVEIGCLFAIVVLALGLQHRLPTPVQALVLPALVVALLVVLINVTLGMYRRREKLSSSSYLTRFLLAPAIGVPLAGFVAEYLPGGQPLQDNLLLLTTLAAAGLLVVRHAVVLPLVAVMAPHRVLVLGTGPEARLVEASLSGADLSNMSLVGFYALEREETVVSSSQIVARSAPLEDVVRQLGVHEIIVAVRQQRGGVLPLRGLLDCRLRGIQVTDLARFFERVHGRVPIESLKVSWLIYGDGYRQNWLRAFVKRVFDISVSAALLLLTAPVMFLSAALIAIESPGPVIYRQTRVGRAGKLFTVLKFRSMARDAEKDGTPQWASVNDARVTRIGRLLRRTRIDELPQLINVITGEMSFVGPRPERPEFVAMLTEQVPFYAVRNSVKPGLTGWAQVRYSYGATVEQSVKKLEYDLYYVKNHTLLLDLVILLETVRVVLFGEGAR